MIDAWIALARGPLFRICLAICLLGLFYHGASTGLQFLAARARAADRRLPYAQIAGRTLAWLSPWRILSRRPIYGTASLLFHAGALLLPLFFMGHVGLLGAVLPGWWPRFGLATADVLTWLMIGGLAWLLATRLLLTRSRDLTRFTDVAVLVVLLLVALSGYWAAHPAGSPWLSGRAMVLVHILLGNLTLVLLPNTKMVHVVLFPFTQLVSEIGWHFPAASGRHVAAALGKEHESI